MGFQQQFSYARVTWFLLLAIGIGWWASGHWWVWYIFAVGSALNCLRQAAYATPATQPSPKGLWQTSGFVLHKILYPIALPISRLELRGWTALLLWVERKWPESFVAAMTREGADVRRRRFGELGLADKPLDRGAVAPLPTDDESGEFDHFLFSMDPNRFSRIWPFASRMFAIALPFIGFMVTLGFRFGDDPTRKRSFNRPTPCWVGSYRASGEVLRSFDDLQLRETTYIGWNPVLGDLQQACLANFIDGQYRRSFQAILAAFPFIDQLRQTALGGQGRASREDYLLNTAFWVNMALSLIPRYHVPTVMDLLRLYEHVVRAKAAEIDVLAVRREIVQRAPKQTKRLWRRTCPSFTEWARVEMEKSARTYRLRAFKLRLRDMLSDIYLGAAVHLGAIEDKLDKISWSSIVDGLPKDSVVIDYYRYSAMNFTQLKREEVGEYGEDRYFAFLVSREGMKYADLGSATAIDKLVFDYRSAIAVPLGDDRDASDGELTFESASESLSKKLIFPFAEAIEKAQHIFVSPDSTLAEVTFASLPSPRGGMLLDHCPISYVESARWFGQTGESSAGCTSPVVMGAPDFSLGSKGTHDWFEALSGAEREVAEVAALLNVSPISGASATEVALTANPRPAILHIASHGFYVSRRREMNGDNGVRSGALNRWEAIARLEKPLLRSGVALSGANTWLSGETLPAQAGDGLLMADDVLDLDLRGTELVVLSACETGMGEAVGGQGVFGLRHAFAVAGAQSQLVSLWKVGDDSSRELMVGFYAHLLSGFGKAEALRAAQQELRQTRPHPFDWAGFICIGNVDPLGSSAQPKVNIETAVELEHA